MKKLLSILFLLMIVAATKAQDTIRYTGSTLSNVDYHDGQLSPAVGVHNIQTMRADRSFKGVLSWTYNHQPMLAYWHNTFYLEYLSNPVGEHVYPGRTLLQVSRDGYAWNLPVVIFPEYKLADGTVKEGRKDTAHNAYAVMHQRIGFYTSKAGKLYALGYYGIALGQHDDPNDGNGIGRVIREIKPGGSFGPIYFFRYNHKYNEKNTSYPFYKTAEDKTLVTACEEILNTALLMQQMVEEADRDDPLIPLKKDLKAFNYYRLPDGKRIVGLWKYALTSITTDEGKTWQYNPTRAPGFVNANAKIWGQRTSDGKYATVYNPSEYRWPLAISISDDGLNYKNLLLVNGEITSMRYGGAFKSYGPQYVRGIQEMDGTPPDKNLWVAYSMNKEDIWVSKIPVPVRDKVTSDVNDVFNEMPDGKELDEWNFYSPIMCHVAVVKFDNEKKLALHDQDPFDYAKAERVIPASKRLTATISLTPKQNDFGVLEIEMQDAKGTACLRIMLDSTGSILTKQGYRNKSLGTYKGGEKLSIKIDLNTTTRFYTVSINDGKPNNNLCFAPVHSVNRIVFRTGAVRRFPNADTPTDQDYDLPNANAKQNDSGWFIHSLQTKKLE